MSLSQSCFQCTSSQFSYKQSRVSLCFIVPTNVRTMIENARSDLQTTSNPAFQSGRPSCLFKQRQVKRSWTDWPQKQWLFLHCTSKSKVSSLPYHHGWPLFGTVPRKRPLTILSSNVFTRSSAKLPPHLYTAQQPTISWKWLWPPNNLWGTWTGSFQTLSPQSHYSR